MSDALATLPPQSIEAEQAALGSALIELSALEKSAGILTPADFYRDVHAKIFDAILTIHGRGQQVDLLTLEEELTRRSQIDLVGGIAYLMTLMEAPSSAANIAHYAGIVKDKSLRRTGIAAAEYVALTLRDDPDGLSKIQSSNGRYHFSEILKGEKTRPVAMCLSDIISVDTHFVWFPWIPRGEMTVISGVPGTMKTFLLIDIAARLTTGRPMPLCLTECDPINVLYIDAENKPSTIRKRMVAAGGNLARFFILTDDDLADLSDAYDTLKHYVLLHKARVIFIDPFNSFVPDAIERAGKIAIRQRLFKPLRRLCAETGVTIVYLLHNRKGGASGIADATQLAAGYQEYTSVPRSAIITVKHPKIEHSFLLHSTKVNDAARPQSIIYRIEDEGGTGRMVYDGVTDEYNADNSAFHTSEKPEQKAERADVKSYLLEVLADGAWHKAAEVEKACYAEFGGTGVRSTLQRARKELLDAGKIAHRKGGMSEPHWWCLAGTTEASPVPKPQTWVTPLPATQTFLETLDDDDPYADPSNFDL